MRSDPRHRAGRINAVLVAAGDWHDIDFARLELLKLLAEDDRIRVRVFENYENLDALRDADLLITYTCNVMPSPEAQQALRDWLQAGGRWFALHGTNAVLRMIEGGRRVDTPDVAPLFMQTLGSMFRAHPPIAPYRVHVTDPDHPLVTGIEPFDTDDELYLMQTWGDLKVLLHARYEGSTPEFTDSQWPEASHPVMYLHEVGQGAVLYLTLGHCRGHYDMQPAMAWWPTVDRCAWNLPQYYELLRRGLRWGIEPIDADTAELRRQHQGR